MATYLLYRLTIPAPGSVFAPGQSANPADTDFWVTSSRDPADHNYITTLPQDDGDRLDVLTSEVADGACQIGVSDVDQGGGATGGLNDANDSLDGVIFPPAGWALEGQAALGTGATTGPEGDLSTTLSAFVSVGSQSPIDLYGRVAKTFSGLPVGATFDVVAVCRQQARLSPLDGYLPSGYGIVCRLQATVDGGTTTADGVEYDAVIPAGHEPWTSLTARVTVGATGTIRVSVGWYSALAGYVITNVDFDTVTITQVASPGLPAGRYVTLWLADTSARQQLLGREGWVERSTDGGTTWSTVRHGYVTDIELPGAQEWFITVGGARRRERNTPVARILQGLSDWDVFRPTAIMGGPVVGGLPGVLPDLGRPRFAVVATQANTSAGAGDGHVALEFRYGPLAPRWESLVTGQPQRPPDSIGPGTATWADGFDLANARARPFYVDSPPRIANGSAPNGPVFFRGYFPRLGVWLYDTSAGTLVAGPLTPFGLFQLNPPTYAGGGVSDLGKLFERASGNGNGTFWLDWAMDNPDVLAAVGTILEVVIAPLEPTADYPLWYVGHPAVVAREALEAIGCSVEATFDSGWDTETKILGYLSDPSQKVNDFLSDVGALMGFGVTLAAGSAARARIDIQNRVTVAGLTAVGDDDLRAIGGPTFTLRESTRRNVYRVRLSQFVPWDIALGAAGIARPITELVTFETPFEFLYSTDGSAVDADTYGEQAIELTLTACVTMGNSNPPSETQPVGVVNQYDFLEALAHRLFDRHGRGTPEYGLALTGAVSLSEGLGDAIALSTSHFPNALPTQTPSSQRGGVRPVRIIARTREPAGDMLTAIDEGSGVAYAGAFDISVAEDTIDPTTFLQVTITGVTQLTSDGALVDLFVGLMAAGSTVSPDHAGTLLKTVDTRALATATHTVRLGPLPPNVIWWVRAEAWVYGGAPSSSTYWYSVTGPDTSGNPTAGPGGTPGSTPPPNTPPTPVGSVSSLAFTNVGTDYFTATWTSTDSSYPVAIRLKATGAASWEFSTLLGVGSTQYQFLGLVPNTDYTVEVNLASLATGGPLGPTLSATQATNAGAATLTLNAPGGWAVFANYDPTHANAHAPGAVGFRVLVTPVVPHFVRMEMTAETAVGSGVPGPWPSIGDPLAFAQDLPATNDFLYMVRYVSNDGRKRYFRAQAWKQVGGTRIASAWTSTLEVMPYTNVQVSGSGQTLQQEFAAAAVTGTGATGINGSTGSVDIAAANTVTAWRFAANDPLRLRLYSSAAARDADATRVINATYAPGSGLYYEIILPDASASLVVYPSPTPTFGPATSGSVRLYYTLASTRDSTNVSDLLVQMIYTTT